MADGLQFLKFIVPQMATLGYEFKYTLGKLYSGAVLENKMLEAAIQNCKDIGCFVAGTLVHTDKGLVPIEQIKVGDMVLSKPEDGTGEAAYKPVVKTVEFEDKEIYVLPVRPFPEREEPFEISWLLVTPNHPFWYVGQAEFCFDTGEQTLPNKENGRWIRADELTYPCVIELKDGQLAVVRGRCHPLFQSAQNNVAWLQGHGATETPWRDDTGFMLNLNENFCPTYHSMRIENANWDSTFDGVLNEDGSYPIFKHKVYNFEVADFHTYYVGEHGVWVHNTNCPKNESHVPTNAQTKETLAATAAHLQPTHTMGCLRNVWLMI